MKYASGSEAVFELPLDAGAAGDLDVSELRCASTKRFLKLTDQYGSYWIDLDRAEAFLVDDTGPVALARRYSDGFEEIGFVFEPDDLRDARDLLNEMRIVELEALTGGSCEEERLGKLGGKTGSLDLR